MMRSCKTKYIYIIYNIYIYIYTYILIYIYTRIYYIYIVIIIINLLGNPTAGLSANSAACRGRGSLHFTFFFLLRRKHCDETEESDDSDGYFLWFSHLDFPSRCWCCWSHWFPNLPIFELCQALSTFSEFLAIAGGPGTRYQLGNSWPGDLCRI